MSISRHLETDSLSNQSIASATAIGAYTADADRMIVCDVSIDQAAGNGDYVVYMTRQIGGAGSAYVLLPKTTCAAASGETAIAMQSGPITVRSGDVVTVYVDGLAGDTTTPDTTVRWFEMATLRPATADRTLTVAATGQAAANVTLWQDGAAPDLATALTTLDGIVDDILVDTGTTLPGLIAALETMSLEDALEGTVSLGEALRVMLAALAGVSSGGGAATLRFKAQDGSTDRIVATVDGRGNRTAVTLDGAE